MQDIVVGNKQFTEATRPNEIVSLLLNDDELANLDKTQAAPEHGGTNANAMAISVKKRGKQAEQQMTGDIANGTLRDLWADEGDDFFGQGNNAADGTLVDDDGNPPPLPKPSRGRGRGRGSRGGRGRGRGRGTVERRRSGLAAGDALPVDF